MNLAFEKWAESMACFLPKAIMPCIKGLSAMAPMLEVTKVASICLPCARGFGVSSLTICSSEAASGSNGGERKFPALAGKPKMCFCALEKLNT